MSIIVQKFGGTSVADSKKILAAARKAIRAQKNGHQVVMVVSAMGKNTDQLVSLAREITDEPPAREMDMLLSTGEQVSVALMAMAVHSLGHDAISFTGAQIGIVTDSTHTRARIKSISTDRMQAALDAGKIVIAAGFQGVDDANNITTLGRGGSDTTAVALAAVLGASSCEIYTDVDGVYTTDPRVVPEARRLLRISYDEMLELASVGAGVMHNRSIEFAKKFGVPIHVRAAYSDNPGTIISPLPETLRRPVSGAALVKGEARVTVLNVPDRPGAAMTVFSQIAARHIAMDMIVQNIGEDGIADISFTVARDDLPATLKAVEDAIQELDAGGFTYDDGVAKVSVVGAGMATQTGVAREMFRALAEHGINIQMITTSEIKISCLVEREFGAEALRAVHEAFDLEVDTNGTGGDDPQANELPEAADAVELAARMHGMEDLIIGGIESDEQQARVTIVGVPDTPGLAAQAFDEIAEAGIMVDMIVQSAGRLGHNNVSFTVPQNELDAAVRHAADLSKRLGGKPPTQCPEVAKLSVTGVGMRSHTDVAARMFGALARRSINVDLISTSEVRVNVVVDRASGAAGLEALQEEFADVLV